MSESLRVTIDYERGEDGWIVASIPEVPGANSQGRTRQEARANVIDALRGVLDAVRLRSERGVGATAEGRLKSAPSVVGLPDTSPHSSKTPCKSTCSTSRQAGGHRFESSTAHLEKESRVLQIVGFW